MRAAPADRPGARTGAALHPRAPPRPPCAYRHCVLLQEDDAEYADSRILERYRAARVAELKAAAARNKFGVVSGGRSAIITTAAIRDAGGGAVDGGRAGWDVWLPQVRRQHHWPGDC